MDSKHITVVYKWTAKPGKLEELTAIYADVTKAMDPESASNVIPIIDVHEKSLIDVIQFIGDLAEHFLQIAEVHEHACFPQLTA